VLLFECETKQVVVSRCPGFYAAREAAAMNCLKRESPARVFVGWAPRCVRLLSMTNYLALS